MRTRNLKNYLFIFIDKDENDLMIKYYQFYNIKEAKIHASKLLAESRIYDLDKITVKREYEKH
jgi:hypothetical protein